MIPQTQHTTPYCHWHHATHKSTQLKIAGTTILTALAAAALVASTLWILASQGINLGALNAITSAIPIPAAHTIMATAAVMTILDIFAIIMLIKSKPATKPTVLPNNDPNDHDQEIEEEIKRAFSQKAYPALQDQQYASFETEMQQKTIYALAYQEYGLEEVVYKHFGTAALRTEFIDVHLKQFYDADLELCENAVLALGGNIPKFETPCTKYQYHVGELYSQSDQKLYFLRLCSIHANQLYRFFKTVEARDLAAQVLIQQGYYNIHTLASLIHGPKGIIEQKQLYQKCILKNLFLPIQLIVNGREVYAVIVSNYDRQKKAYWLSHISFIEAGDREAFLLKNTDTLIPLESLFVSPECYNPEHIHKMISPTHLLSVKESQVATQEFITYNIPLLDSQRMVYPLIFKDQTQENVPTHIHYFSTLTAREDFIQNQLSMCKDKGAIQEALYGTPKGMQGKPGIIASQHLEMLLVPQSAFIHEIEAHGKTYYIWVRRTAQDIIETDCSDTLEEQEEALTGYTDVTQWIKDKNHQGIFETIQSISNHIQIPAILSQQNEYWPEQVLFGQNKTDVIFYFDDSKIRTRVFFATYQAQAFLSTRRLINAKDAFETSQEYPIALGEALANLTLFPMQAVESMSNSCLSNEYFVCRPYTIDTGLYKEMHLVFYRDATGKKLKHFFKTKEARDKFIQELIDNGYKDSYLRGKIQNN